MVQEKAGKYKDAITNLRQYLLLSPNASDAETVKSLVNKLEYKAEQTITDEVALDIFGSLGDSSKWQYKEPDNANFREMKITGRDGKQIVITYRHETSSKPRDI